MISRITIPPRRRAAYIVEFALVGPLVLTLLFASLEWCLYLMTLNQAQNAAREGARYAVVRTDTYQSFPGAQTYLNKNPPDTYDAGVYTQAQVVAWVQNYLNTAGAQINNLEITVYKVNSLGQPIDLNGNVIPEDPTAETPTNQGNWNQTRFGDLIAVRITGTYAPVIPGLSQIGLAPPVFAMSAMGSEGN
jgi:Flp pilus assembly protein TadG